MIRDLIFRDHNPFAGIQYPVDLGSRHIQGWNSEHQIFEILIKQLQPKTICEVGSWKGASAIHMAHFAPPGCEIICVDTWLGSLEFFTDENKRPLLNLKNGRSNVYNEFLQNVAARGYDDTITPFPATSSMASRFFKHHGIKFDLTYIDASHEFSDVLVDLNYWAPISGVIFGDDYDWPTVRDAVNVFATRSQLRLELHDMKWILRP